MRVHQTIEIGSIDIHCRWVASRKILLATHLVTFLTKLFLPLLYQSVQL